MNALLVVVGKARGDNAHAANAITATYTLAVGSLVKSCATRLDCSDATFTNSTTGVTTSLGSSLNIDPAVQCETDNSVFLVMALVATIGFFAYGFILPLTLFCRMRKAVKDGRLQDSEFVASAAWVLLKYKSSAWWFEFPLLAYKVFMICTSVLLNSASHAWVLLASHVAATTGLAMTAQAFQPYVTADANTMQLVALGALLATYGVGGACLVLDGECEDNSILEFAVIAIEALLFVGVIMIGMRVAKASEDDASNEGGGGETQNPMVEEDNENRATE
eukprot:SAG31_NODE_3332_length_4395_cov_3.833799_3_plen_278_part_00